MIILHKLILITYLVLLSDVDGQSRVDPLVETKVGLIRGLRATDGEYSMFLGIPFAKVDEANPFGPSTPHPDFEETFEAYDDSAICPQTEEFNNSVVGTLDCLHLNIYIPDSASSANRLPILVFIYGGGFLRGFSGRFLYGPKYLVRHDIIIVTLNYRVGPYGFMCLNTPDVPGNQGLKDQLLALRWIKDNIASFGGDVNRITLCGRSAGGISVDYHMLSPQEKLFSNVIMQSGSSLLPGRIDPPDSEIPLKLAVQLGLVTNDSSEALSFLSTVDPKLVTAASSSIQNSFRPCVENDFENVEKFITDYPVNQNIPKIYGIPILIGNNNNEMIYTYGTKDEKYFENLTEFQNRLISAFNFDSNELYEMENIVRHFYIGDEDVSIELIDKITDFASDFHHYHATERSIVKYVENGASRVFHYMFSFDGDRNYIKKRLNITQGGVAHADEIGYMFDISYMTEEPSPADQLTIDRVTAMWANFVKYSDPTPETSEMLPVKWEPITRGSANYYLDIDSELSLGSRPFQQRMAFWDLFYKFNEKSQKGYRDTD